MWILIRDEDIRVISYNTDTNLGHQRANNTEEVAPAKVANIAVDQKGIVPQTVKWMKDKVC